MTWWLKAHRAGPLAAMSAALGLLAWLAASGRILSGSVASPVKAGSAVPLALWLPLGIAAALCWSCSVDDVPGARIVAVRSNRLLLTGFTAAATATATATVCLLPAAVAAPAITASVSRNIAGLAGLALIVRPRLGAAGASAAVAGYLATPPSSEPSHPAVPPGGPGLSPSASTHGEPWRPQACSQLAWP